jgi:hypothetical protein
MNKLPSPAVSFLAHLEHVDGPMVHHVIIIPDEISKQFIKGKGSVRILCRIGDKPEFPCALVPRHGRYVVIASLKLIRENNLLIGSRLICLFVLTPATDWIFLKNSVKFWLRTNLLTRLLWHLKMEESGVISIISDKRNRRNTN